MSSSFSPAILSGSQMHVVCQNLNNIGQLGNEHFQIAPIFPYTFAAPHCIPKVKKLFKPIQERLPTQFRNLVTFFKTNEKALSEKEYLANNLETLRKLEAYFSPRSSRLNLVELSSLISTLAAKIPSEVAAHKEALRTATNNANKVTAQAKKELAEAVKDSKKRIEAVQTVLSKTQKDRQKSEQEAKEAQNRAATTPPLKMSIAIDLNPVLRTMKDYQDSNGDIYVTYDSGHIKIHERMLRTVVSNPLLKSNQGPKGCTSYDSLQKYPLEIVSHFVDRVYHIMPTPKSEHLLDTMKMFREVGIEDCNDHFKKLLLEGLTTPEKVFQFFRELKNHEPIKDLLTDVLVQAYRIDKNRTFTIGTLVHEARYNEAEKAFELFTDEQLILDMDFYKSCQDETAECGTCFFRLTKDNDRFKFVCAKWELKGCNGNYISDPKAARAFGVLHEVAGKFPQAKYYLAKLLNDLKDPKGLTLLYELALSGFDCHSELVSMFFQKGAIPEEFRNQKTIEWLKGQKSNEAIYLLCQSYALGYGVAVNPKEALKYHKELEQRKAAVSFPLTLDIFNQAANDGDEECQIKMIQHFFEQRKNLTGTSNLSTFITSKTVEWLAKWENRSNVKADLPSKAMFILGITIIKSDAEKGSRYLISAMSEAYTRSFDFLEMMKNQVAQDILPKYWNEFACKGNQFAQLYLIDRIYSRPHSQMEKELQNEKTIEWLSDCADVLNQYHWNFHTQQCLRARWILANCYLKGIVVKKDEGQAAILLARAAYEFPQNFWSLDRDDMLQQMQSLPRTIVQKINTEASRFWK